MDTDISIEDEVWKNLSEILDFSDGKLDGEWICFNIKSGAVGMAYPYKGEWRIRESSVTDEDIRSAQERRFNSMVNELGENND